MVKSMWRVRSCVGEGSALPYQRGTVIVTLNAPTSPGFSSESADTDRHFSATASYPRNAGSCGRQRTGTRHRHQLCYAVETHRMRRTGLVQWLGAREYTSKHHATRYHAAYAHV